MGTDGQGRAKVRKGGGRIKGKEYGKDGRIVRWECNKGRGCKERRRMRRKREEGDRKKSK